MALPGSCQDSSCHGAPAEACAALRAFSASDLALFTAASAAAFCFIAIASSCLTFALSQQSIAVFRAKCTNEILFSRREPPPSAPILHLPSVPTLFRHRQDQLACLNLMLQVQQLHK